jgi:hypothetical protein
VHPPIIADIVAYLCAFFTNKSEEINTPNPLRTLNSEKVLKTLIDNKYFSPYKNKIIKSLSRNVVNETIKVK